MNEEPVKKSTAWRWGLVFLVAVPLVLCCGLLAAIQILAVDSSSSFGAIQTAPETRFDAMGK